MFARLVKTLCTRSLFPNDCFHTVSTECVDLFTLVCRDTPVGCQNLLQISTIFPDQEELNRYLSSDREGQKTKNVFDFCVPKVAEFKVLMVRREKSSCWEMCQFNRLAVKPNVMSVFLFWDVPH